MFFSLRDTQDFIENARPFTDYLLLMMERVTREHESGSLDPETKEKLKELALVLIAIGDRFKSYSES